MVRVVVRDAKGAAVDNLRQQDFQLFDHGKLQTILHFSLEKPALKAPEPPPQKPAVEPEATDETAMPAAAARRFLAMYFDDVNTPFDSLVRGRDAADHFLTTSVQPGDRVALYTSSGLKQLDFTDNLAQVHQALLDLRPRPIVPQDASCGSIPPYQAYLIAYQHDANAIAEAAAEILNCNSCLASADRSQDQQQCLSLAQSQAQSDAIAALARAETQSNAALRGIESIIRRLASLPGQRSMVIVSSGFLTETLGFEISQISDRALRAGVIINAVDARGLWTDPVNDASQRSFAPGGNLLIGSSTSGSSRGSSTSQSNLTSVLNPSFAGQQHLMLIESARRQTDGMQSLALDSGGVFFNNNNDLEAGFHRASALPEAYYLLAFSPQNLKLDGAFHPLQVKLVAVKGLQVQARRGYFAPRKPNDPSVQEQEEIREAVFSHDEMHDLPIDVHTQFFMKSEANARVTVLTRIDMREWHFRREEDRNIDNLIFATVLFDQDGHVITSDEKAVHLLLRDNSLERYQQTGITIRSLFDVKPGTYLVRAIVRDSESGQISSLNRTVEIPY
jgi:VWFA-related protein